jgi:hypothetical protein
MRHVRSPRDIGARSLSNDIFKSADPGNLDRDVIANMQVSWRTKADANSCGRPGGYDIARIKGDSRRNRRD